MKTFEIFNFIGVKWEKRLFVPSSVSSERKYGIEFMWGELANESK